MNSPTDKSEPLEPVKVSGWGQGKARSYWLAMALFALLFCVLLAIMARDFRGRPIYPNINTLQEPPPEEVSGFLEGEPFVLEFVATQPNYDEIYWVNLLPVHGQLIEVKVENLTQGREVAVSVTGAGSNTIFTPNNEVGDRMRVSMRWLRPPAPHLLLSESPPRGDVTVAIPGGDEVPTLPVFYFGHKPDPRAEWDRSLLLVQEDEFERAHAAGLPGGSSTDFDRILFEDLDPVTIRFTAQMDDLNFLMIPGLLEYPKTRVKIVVRNETSGEVIKNSMAEGSSNYEKRFPGNNQKGDRIAVDLFWRMLPAPTLQQVSYPAEPPIAIRVGDREVEFRLAMLLRSPWPTWFFHWLWLPVLIGFLVVWFRNRWAFRYLVVLGIACSATSMLVWQQCYAHDYPHIDPDGYGVYGEEIAHFFTGEEDRGQLRTQMREYAHSHVVLVPLLIAIGVVCGLPTTIAYLVVANLASFGSLLLLWRLATRKLGMQMRAAVMLITFYATHLLVLKSFGRTSTDAVGELLVVVMLYLLIDRLSRVTARQTILISVVILLQALARPPGIVIGPFMLGMTLLCDVWREQKLDLGKRVLTGVKLGLGPLLVLAFCYWRFDWIYNQQLAMEKSKKFHPFSTFYLFLCCMPGLLQIFPLFWTGLGWKEWRSRLPKLAVVATWGLFFIILLIAVKAPFLPRLFLPVVLAVILLAAPGVTWLESKCRSLALVVCILWSAVNVGIQIYVSSIEYLPPVLLMGDWRIELGRFIY